MESCYQDPSQFLGQTTGLLEADCLQGITLNSDRQMAIKGDSSVQPTSDRFESLQLGKTEHNYNHCYHKK